MKYKVLDIKEKELIKVLEDQAKLNFEPIKWLKETAPDSYSDDRIFKVLFRSFKK